MTVNSQIRRYGKSPWVGVLWLFSCILALFAESAAGGPKPPHKRYALIVANNLSLDEGVAPLLFADDDGARYFELFTAAGAEATLLTTLDADAQRRYPGAAKVALPPNRRSLTDALTRIFANVEADTRAGAVVHFYFVYAGHGNVGPNQEGYLNLLDARFGRSSIYNEIVAKSPATFNHLILDACHAYFMVNKRGDAPDREGDYRAEVRDYLKNETLARYPNTGVVLAASSESETHEWRRLESGIFSHEVRSALLGAGDVNNDGLVTYAETAAFVEAANAAIDLPRARLQVYAHPPAQQIDVPLMATRAFEGAPILSMPPSLFGRYHVEDARGVRTLDLHYSSEQAVALRLVGEAPFYVRRADEEAVVTVEMETAALASLRFSPLSERRRGSVEASFRKHLFEIPFGIGFFRGMSIRAGRSVRPEKFGPSVARNDTPSAPPRPPPMKAGVSPKRSGLSPIRLSGLASLGCGLAIGASSGIVYAFARAEYEDYKAADTRADAKTLRESSDTLLSTSRVLLGVGGGLSILGVGLVVGDLLKQRKSRSRTARQRVAPFGVIDARYGFFGVLGDF